MPCGRGDSGYWGEVEAAGLAIPAVNGPQRYNELLKTVTGISQKELTRNLKELTSAGLVMGAYELTPLGKGLMPTFKKLLTWGTHLPVR
jgi:DNA-binding HxlR family transcriptional regulator